MFMRYVVLNRLRFWGVVFFLITAAETTYGTPVVSISDEGISREIRMELTSDDAIAEHYIDVTVKDGYVTLSGSVDNLLSKDRAARVCGSIRGVRGITNQLMVLPVKRTEAQLSADVKLLLLQFPINELMKLTSSVQHDTVILGGTAQTLAEKQLAEEVVKGVAGVRMVRNTINVVPPVKRSNREIKEEIEGLLESDPFLKGIRLNVTVKKGTVRLKGEVNNYAEKLFARSDASVDGTIAVIDSGITVKLWGDDTFRRKEPLTVRPDSEIQMVLKTLLGRDPKTFEYSLTNTVKDGIVTLGGTVGTIASRRRAEEIAFSIVGVYRVVNRIRVRPESPLSNTDLEKRLSEVVKRDPIVDVDNRYERNHVERLMEKVPGIVAIANYIGVRDDKRAWVQENDSLIRKRILDRYQYVYLIDPGDLKVSVKDGIATVTGNIESIDEWRAIVGKAFHAGAKVVVTHLLFNGMRLNEVYDHPDSWMLE
jgi:osmotically-inducible protein OsmY